MKSPSVQQGVEVFHLLLLAFMGKKMGKQSYALKGGCNLRFFFGSPRYSEDMDIDLEGVPIHVVQETVDAILRSTPFRQALQVNGLEVEHVTEHKQSETTQRWKLGLRTPGTERPVPTKVEFSRRGLGDGVLFGPVDPALLHRYGMAPIMTSHYSGATALLQKIEALATRKVTQARDIFDFHLLQSEERMRQVRPLVDRARIERAKQNALDLSYDDFKGQVLAFLHPDDQGVYDAPEIWESIQLNVAEVLERVE